MSEEIVVGSVAVEVVPTARGFASKLDAQVSPEARAVGKQIGERLGRDISAPIAPAVRDALREGGRSANEQGRSAGNEFAGSFATIAKTRLEAAFKALPKAHVGTDASELDAELVAIKARLHALSDVRIGIDLDAGQALAEVELLKERVTSLGARSPHIDVKVDAARAVAELTAIEALVTALDANDVNVNVDVDSGGSIARAGAGLSGVATAALILGPALVPIAAGILAIVGAASLLVVVLGGAFAALAIGLIPIVKTMQALSAADKQSASSSTANAAARVAAADAVRSATASLANTIASADSAAVRSAIAVTDARRGVADAQRAASQAVTRALGAQASAEGALAVAQRNSREAAEALTRARKDAQQQLDDLARATKGGALDARQATLDIAAARQHLQEVNANPLATSADRQQAKLDYDKAVQQLDDITARNQTLADTKAAADKAGVEGSQGVIAAQQNLADADARVAAAQTAVADAAAALTEARRAGAEAVAKAEEQVTAALAAQDDQARQSAFAISQAHAALAAAQQQQQTASVAASKAATDAKRQFDSLSPAGQAFVTFLRTKLMPALHGLTTSATDGLVPGLTAGLQALLPVMPAISTGLDLLATAAGDLFAQAATALASPFWVNFFTLITGIASPALKVFGDIMGGLATGFGGLLIAFIPVAKSLGDGLKIITDHFAKFGTSTGKGGALDRFIGFLTEKGPGIAQQLGEIAKAIGHIIVALAPIGALVLTALGGLAQTINDIPTPVLVIVVALIVALAIGMGILAIASALVEAPILAIGIAIALVIVGFVLLYKHSALFRGFVDGIWTAVKFVFDWIKDHWKLLLGILTGPIGAAVILIATHWQTIKDGARAAKDWIVARFNDVVGFFEKLPGRMKTAVVGLWGGIKDGFKAAINWIIDAWNGLNFKLPSVDTHIPGVGKVGGFELGTPDIPRLALGGIVTSPTLALVGEGHESEAVMPLSFLSQMLAEQRGAGIQRSHVDLTGRKAGTVIEKFEQNNYHPAEAYTNPREEMMRLQHALSGL